MRVLHTSDWHVGRTLHRLSRFDEARDVLAEIVDLAIRERVDAVIVCGDVFEHLSPAPEAEQIVYDTLLKLGEAKIAVVLITGNHDHPARWRAIAPLLSRFRIHVVDQLHLPEQGGVIEISSANGQDVLQVVAVPWISERRVYEVRDFMGSSEQTYTTYADGMKEAFRKLCEGLDPAKCNLLAAHIFIDGSTISESERTLTSGDIYAISPDAIPTNLQYAALGHVHKPQVPPGFGGRVGRYCGSPMQLDFGEAGQEKRVYLVDMVPGTPAKVREVPITSGRKLLEVAGTLAEIEQQAHGLEECYLKVKLACDGPRPGLSDQVRELLPNALLVTLEYPDQAQSEVVDVRSKSPRELFETYLSSRYSSAPDPAMLDLFEELVAEVPTN